MFKNLLKIGQFVLEKIQWNCCVFKIMWRDGGRDNAPLVYSLSLCWKITKVEIWSCHSFQNDWQGVSRSPFRWQDNVAWLVLGAVRVCLECRYHVRSGAIISARKRGSSEMKRHRSDAEPAKVESHPTTEPTNKGANRIKVLDADPFAGASATGTFKCRGPLTFPNTLPRPLSKPAGSLSNSLDEENGPSPPQQSPSGVCVTRFVGHNALCLSAAEVREKHKFQ